MPPTATAVTHLDCTPLDVVLEGSLVEALQQPPLDTLAHMGWFAVALGVALALAALAALLGRRRTTESWVALLAGIAALVAADAVWFDAAEAAEAIRSTAWALAWHVRWLGTLALAKGVLGLAVAAAALAHLPIARRRLRAKEGRPARRAALASLAVLAAPALLGALLEGLDGRAREARLADLRQRRDLRGAAFIRGRRLLDARHREPLYARAFAAVDDLDYGEAERIFEEALARRPDDPDLLFARALERIDRDARGDAATDLRRVLALDPGYDRARALLELLEPWSPRR